MRGPTTIILYRSYKASNPSDIIKVFTCSGTVATDALILGLGLLTLTGIWGNDKKVMGIIPLAFGGAGLVYKLVLKECGEEFVNNPWSKS